MKNDYQTNYSDLYAHQANYDNSRKIKAQKTFLIIKDYFSNINNDLKKLKVLEIGCYKGDISIELANNFFQYYAIDIDQKAIKTAENKEKPDNLYFLIGNAEKLEFEDQLFDIVICSHVYEHVPNPQKMMFEINRVLKANGVCYFAGGNKYKIIEPHYRLPFLSWLPKKLAHIYLKITGKGNYYFENLKNYLQLKKLVDIFEIADYTHEILYHPQKFAATDMFEKGSFKQYLAKFIYKYFKFFFPTFIWILKKVDN